MISLFLTNCSSLKNSNSEVVAVVTKKENLDKYLGELITINGEIRNSKIRVILGVDVRYDGIIEEGSIATATGILIKSIVTDATPYSANRENCTIYRLQNKNKKEYDLAIAKIVKQ